MLEMAKLEKERGGERRFHFDFAGKFFEKSEEDFFWNYIKGNELEDYVTFHGVVGGDKKRDLLKRCDVFVLLTTYPNEGQPISILEAMGNGMVVVATDHAGIPDLISQDDGLIYDSKHISIPVILNDVSSLEEKIIIRRARLEVMDKYTQNYYIRAIGTVYKEILTD